MAIKAIQSISTSVDYPKIVIFTENTSFPGMVCLMASEKAGTVLVGVKSYQPGCYQENWTSGRGMKDYNGPLTLQND